MGVVGLAENAKKNLLHKKWHSICWLPRLASNFLHSALWHHRCWKHLSFLWCLKTIGLKLVLSVQQLKRNKQQ